MRNRRDLAIGSAALLSFVNRFFFLEEGKRRGRLERMINRRIGESFGNKGIASCSVSYRMKICC